MCNLQTLRKKASEAGYSIHKGFQHYMYNGSVVVCNGERLTGYEVVDNTTGIAEPSCYSNVFDHLWQLEDVEEFLKNVYKENNLEF